MNQKPPKDDKKDKEKEKEDDRYLRSRKVDDLWSQGGAKYQGLPRHLAKEYETAMAELEHHLEMMHKDSNQVEGSGWRRLEEHSHGAEFVRRLGDGYHIKVQMLYATPQH